MDFIKCNVLKKHSDLIIKDLHGDVFEELLDKGVLTDDEFTLINSQEEQEDRNRKFLNILYTKPDGFIPFLESLKDWYSWIEQGLRETWTGKPKTWEEAIALSKVPAIPLVNVSRVELLRQVKAALQNLKVGEYVVLHGMSGCGKSSLAAEAIHDNILLASFEGRVIWLSCGHDTKDDENEVLALQREMNAAICDDELVSDVKAATINSLRSILARRFQSTDFSKGLVVLDDVNSPNVIEALRIGCKTLITTQDKDVIRNHASRCTYIEVSESFKEEETLQYLAKCVKMHVDNLPPQAREIHRHGKGHPLIMSLIGADLRDHQDESRRQPDNWQEWLNILHKKEYGVLKRHSLSNELSQQSKTITTCIDNLVPDMKEKYQDFALFVEDVNITTEVLEILWGLTKTEVKKIMLQFYLKSLVVRKYNEAQNSYVYGIHDLLRYFLRQRLDAESLKNLHVKLINRYLEVCKGDLSKLPRNDNYFYYYIGYHIASSQQYEMFRQWYFELDFIEAKLKVAGPGDLLLDYKRYGSHFTDGLFEAAASLVSKRLADFVRFVETVGLEVRLRHNTGPDIVQLALQEPHDSDVYNTALRLVQSRPNKTYLRFQLGPSKSKAAPHTIQLREKVSAACFSNNDNNFIVALVSGTIQIVNERGHKVREYEGHVGRVTQLKISPQRNIFLSVSSDSVQIWKLPDLDFNVFNGGSGDRSPSPSQRQDNFSELFSCKSPDKRKSWFTLSRPQGVRWANFSEDGSAFAVCLMDDKIEVFEATRPEYAGIVRLPWLPTKRMRVTSPTSCAFSSDGKYLAVGSASSFMISINTIDDTMVRKVFPYPVLSVFALPGIKFVVLTKSNLSVWDLDTIIEPNKQISIPCLKDYNRGEAELYTCCAVAVDGSVVAVATSNNKILICDPSNGSIIREIHESTANIVYLAMDMTRNHRLLASYDDSTVRWWQLGEVHTHRPATMKSNFVVAWTQDKPMLVAPTYKACVKKITDLRESVDLPVPVHGDINICAISECGEYIAVGTPSGQVFLHREGPMVNILNIKGNDQDSITKLSVRRINKRLYVVVGLCRSLKVWTCKLKLDGNGGDEGESIYVKKRTFEFPLSDRLVESFLLPTKKLISITSMGNIKRWCMKRGQMERVLVHGRLDDVQLCAAALSRDLVLATVASASAGNTLNFYTAGATEFERNSYPLDYGKPTCCSFSVDGKKLAVGFKNGLIKLWDMTSLKHRTVSTGGEAIGCVCVSRTGVIGAATKTRFMLVTSSSSVGQARLSVTRLVMFPDDSTILTVDSDGHLHLVDQFNNSNNSSSVVRLSRSFSNM